MSKKNTNKEVKQKEETKKEIKHGIVCEILETITNTEIKGIKSLYNSCKKLAHDYYLESKDDMTEIIATIENKKQINTYDMNKLFNFAVLEEKYTERIRIVHGITTNDGISRGYIWTQINEDGKWINIDVAGAADNSKLKFGELNAEKYIISNIYQPDVEIVELLDVVPVWL